MSGFRDLEIYNFAYKLAIMVHRESLKIRRSSKGVKDAISKSYGRRRYNADYIKYLTYSIASCDETTNHIITIIKLYPDLTIIKELETEYEIPDKKINNYLQYVETSWRL